jgi:hypothetical protein
MTAVRTATNVPVIAFIRGVPTYRIDATEVIVGSAWVGVIHQVASGDVLTESFVLTGALLALVEIEAIIAATPLELNYALRHTVDSTSYLQSVVPGAAFPAPAAGFTTEFRVQTATEPQGALVPAPGDTNAVLMEFINVAAAFNTGCALRGRNLECWWTMGALDARTHVALDDALPISTDFLHHVAWRTEEYGARVRVNIFVEGLSANGKVYDSEPSSAGVWNLPAGTELTFRSGHQGPAGEPPRAPRITHTRTHARTQWRTTTVSPLGTRPLWCTTRLRCLCCFPCCCLCWAGCSMRAWCTRASGGGGVPSASVCCCVPSASCRGGPAAHRPTPAPCPSRSPCWAPRARAVGTGARRSSPRAPPSPRGPHSSRPDTRPRRRPH